MTRDELKDACILCGTTDGGGLYTNGDGFGDGKHVGVEPLPWGKYCWRCVREHKEKIPDQRAEIDAAFAARGLCGFEEAWVGRCKNSKPCVKHVNQKCWKCGQPATRNCNYACSLVCGMPECAEHPHINERHGF